MANRRCFSRQVIESAEFEDMPVRTQMLYIRMCLAADDDGFCEAGSAMRAVQADETDFAELEDNGFILKVPGKKRLYHIYDWRVHNTLEKAKYHQSQYFDRLEILYPCEEGLDHVLPAWLK